VRDAQRIVEFRSSVGWVVDDTEIQQAMPDVMMSACQTPDADRAEALAWLDDQIAARGGDVATAWRARGKDLGKVDDLLALTRVRLLLGRADEWVRQGRCPFWLEPSNGFAGVQTHERRWVLTLEAGGRGVAAFALGQVRWGAGGSGRVLVGRGFGEEWTLSLGPEVGGDASFTTLELGQLNQFPELAAFMALPVVAKWRFGLAAHLEAEAGPISYVDRATAGTTGVSAHYHTGLRTGVAVGGTFLRLGRGVVPTFAFTMTVDWIPAVGNTPALTQIGFGLRTGIELSRWRRF
jgi:hypothetical protein